MSLSVPPQVQPGPRVLKVLAGEAVDLNCAAEGTPEPRLNWSKDGEALGGGGPEGSVHFAAIRTSDAGVYRCEAANSAGVDAWELELRVLGESLNPTSHPSPPSQQQLGLLRCLSALLGSGPAWPLPSSLPKPCCRGFVSPVGTLSTGEVIDEQGLGPSPAPSTYQLDTLGQSFTLSDLSFLTCEVGLIICEGSERECVQSTGGMGRSGPVALASPLL